VDLFLAITRRTRRNSDGAFGDENYVYVVGGWNTDYIARADVWRIDSTSVDTIGAIERVASPGGPW
jgi:hypothetical protein